MPTRTAVSFAACAAAAISILAAASLSRAALPLESGVPPANAALYAAHCAGCHGSGMEGGQFGPSLRGPLFSARWKGKSAELLKYISTKMPPDAGGTLADAEYRAITDLVAQTSDLASAAVPETNSQAAVGDPVVNQWGAVGPQPFPPERFQDALYKKELAARQALLSAITPVTQQMLRSPPEGDWLNARRTQDASGYSPLRQIDTSNVAGLRPQWAWTLRFGKNEIAPIVHDGVMFINSAYEVEALDAATGTLLWRYAREIPQQHRGSTQMVQRSMAIYGRTLFVPTADRHVVALDVTNGKVVWDTEIVPESMPGVILSSGPLLAGNVLVQGTSMSSQCIGGCYVVGLDPSSGKILWRFDNVAKPGTPGGNSWNGAPAEDRTGASVWVTPTYDPELDILYYGTGGTYDISKLLKPDKPPPGQTNDGLFTNSTLALRPSTGKLLWYHQHMPREVWDLDEVFERTLMNVAVNGKQRRLAVTIGKLGILDALDRTNGRYLFSIDLGLNNIVAAIDPRTGRRTVDPAKMPVFNKPVLICPNVQGVRNWMATAYNPSSHILYLPLQESCMDFTWINAPGSDDGKVDMSWSTQPWPNSDGMYGRLQAIDMTTRRPLWTNRTRAVPAGSLLATGGGLVFGGNSDRWFRALDDRSGKTLWEMRLNAIPNASPITFTANGKQYVAILAGSSGDHLNQSQVLTPELDPPGATTTVWVFGL